MRAGRSHRALQVVSIFAVYNIQEYSNALVPKDILHRNLQGLIFTKPEEH